MLGWLFGGWLSDWLVYSNWLLIGSLGLVSNTHQCPWLFARRRSFSLVDSTFAPLKRAMIEQGSFHCQPNLLVYSTMPHVDARRNIFPPKWPHSESVPASSNCCLLFLCFLFLPPILVLRLFVSWLVTYLVGYLVSCCSSCWFLGWFLTWLLDWLVGWLVSCCRSSCCAVRSVVAALVRLKVLHLGLAQSVARISQEGSPLSSSSRGLDAVPAVVTCIPDMTRKAWDVMGILDSHIHTCICMSIQVLFFLRACEYVCV